jgi:hypothetical protein
MQRREKNEQAHHSKSEISKKKKKKERERERKKQIKKIVVQTTSCNTYTYK